MSSSKRSFVPQPIEAKVKSADEIKNDKGGKSSILMTILLVLVAAQLQGWAVLLRKGPPFRQGRAAGRGYHPHLRRRLCDFAGGAAGSGAGGDRWHIMRRTSYSSPAYSISGFAGGGGR